MGSEKIESEKRKTKPSSPEPLFESEPQSRGQVERNVKRETKLYIKIERAIQAKDWQVSKSLCHSNPNTTNVPRMFGMTKKKLKGI